MKDKDLFFKMVQGQIGYTFQNIDLLHQAFIRRSFSEEHGGQNNEVLEFIGDKALDFAVVRLLVQKYGRLANGDPIDGTKLSAWELEFKRQRERAAGTTPKVNEFICEHSEGQLTKIKSRMVEKKTLEPIQNLQVRRMDGDFFALQGKKSQEYLMYFKIF